ncbi:hypothetical protein HWV62_4681 [Athelia sp. TMB]|nr:hypothetical protein HWV62_4681 [Athelia sp. TMB]
MAPNYYAILGIERDASAEEVKRAYKKKALETHPDKQAPQTPEDVKASAAARFRAVHDAFQILSSPYQRRAYDVRTGAAGSSAEFVRLSDEQVARSRDREEWAERAALARRERMAALEEARKARETATVQRVRAEGGGARVASPAVVERGLGVQLGEEEEEEAPSHETLVTLILEQLCQMNPEWEVRRQEALRVSLDSFVLYGWRLTAFGAV